MDKEPLPSQGPERDIFMVALRDFSERCSPPELIAECPFSVDLENGARGCGEECEKLLARYGPPPAHDEIELSKSGIAARRRPHSKPRGTPLGFRPFDAAEIYLGDSADRPPTVWSAVSLLYGLQQVALAEPGDRAKGDQEDEIPAYLTELNRRGFPVGQIIRSGLGPKIALRVALAVGVRTLAASDSEMATDAILQRWMDLRDEMFARAEPRPHRNLHRDRDPIGNISEEDTARFLYTVHGPFATAVRLWASRVDVDSLLAWSPPDSGVLDQLDGDEQQEEEAEASDANWILDRFTSTYLKDWDQESLRLEWKYQQGRIGPPCPVAEMSARAVDSAELALFVADLAIAHDENPRLKSQAVRTAVDLLKHGSRATAAELFAAFRDSSQDDGELHNNYGFCIIPDDPAKALKALVRAESLGYDDIVNVANRVLALYWLDKPASALEVAERAVERWHELKGVSKAYLWSYDVKVPSSTRLLENVCSRCYLVELATMVANSTGDEVLISRWQRRTADLVLSHDDR